ncbi:hypothetical protein [Neorhizobium sp. NCHU2750]|uniref:hypothetical protein n=1 Tax=Neorhizobium sp. NCHU2750 TaxID=1825976 RepID=UPI000EB74D74|nr:hypothetical protein NCHU2750_15700 [Neorhizobium sp. NCHU2750]
MKDAHFNWVALIVIPLVTAALSVGSTYLLQNSAASFEKFKFASELMRDDKASSTELEWATQTVASYYVQDRPTGWSNTELQNFFRAVALRYLAQNKSLYCIKPDISFLDDVQGKQLDHLRKMIDGYRSLNLRKLDDESQEKFFRSLSLSFDFANANIANINKYVKDLCDGFEQTRKVEIPDFKGLNIDGLK